MNPTVGPFPTYENLVKYHCQNSKKNHCFANDNILVCHSLKTFAKQLILNICKPKYKTNQIVQNYHLWNAEKRGDFLFQQKRGIITFAKQGNLKKVKVFKKSVPTVFTVLQMFFSKFPQVGLGRVYMSK